MTGHFVNNNFELISRQLALKFIPSQHTGIYLSSEIASIIKEWKIEKKVINATIDGGSNINLAVDLTSCLDKLRCLTHTLNLVTKNVLNENGTLQIQDIVKKCRNLVCIFKHSNFLSEQLKKLMEINRNAAKELLSNDKELPPVRKLKQDVPTRWNSTYIMLKSVLDAHDSVKTVINSNSESRKKYSDMILNNMEISVIEDLIELLLPFFQFTEMMSGTKYVTVSIVLPGVTRLLEILQIFKSKFNNKEIEQLSIKMHDDLADRTRAHFDNQMVIAATYLDPRYKKFRFVKDEVDRDRMIKKAQNYIKSTYLTKFQQNHENLDVQPPTKKARIENNVEKNNNFSLLYDANRSLESDESMVIDENQEIENEIKNYSAMKIKVSDHSNPLEFYKNNTMQFKRLSKLSKMLFSITASSVPCEGSFSNAKDIISESRNRLTPFHAEELLMISQNKRLNL